MPNRFAAFGWTIDLAPGWSAEFRQETLFGETTAFLAVVPESKDALLRLTPDDRQLMAASKWVEGVGRINRAKGRTVSAIRCGDFEGNFVQFVSGKEWIRGWALSFGSSPLDATYRCLVAERGRDDSAVDKMLSSLMEGSPFVCEL